MFEVFIKFWLMLLWPVVWSLSPVTEVLSTIVQVYVVFLEEALSQFEVVPVSAKLVNVPLIALLVKSFKVTIPELVAPGVP